MLKNNKRRRREKRKVFTIEKRMLCKKIKHLTIMKFIIMNFDIR